MDRAHLVFLKVAETGNLTAAARELNIAQPSLTRTISKLEEEFGTELFTRLPRGMDLTEAGRVLRAHLEEVRALYRRARADVAAVHRGYHARLRVGAGLTHQMLVMPRVLERLWNRFPRTSFHVRTGAAEAHVAEVLSGELDVTVTAAVPGFRHPSLETRILGTISHGVAFWPGTLPESDETSPLPLSALEGVDWVLLRGAEIKERLERRLFREGLSSPRIAMTTTSLQLGLDLLHERPLVMSVPTILATRIRAQGFRLHATEQPLWQTGTGIAYHRANRDAPLIRALVDEVESVAAALPGLERSAPDP